jgi:hypothetical protein
MSRNRLHRREREEVAKAKAQAQAKQKPEWRGEFKTFDNLNRPLIVSASTLIELNCQDNSIQGVAERALAETRKTATVLGDLIQRLMEKRVLSAEDVIFIAGAFGSEPFIPAED